MSDLSNARSAAGTAAAVAPAAQPAQRRILPDSERVTVDQFAAGCLKIGAELQDVTAALDLSFARRELDDRDDDLRYAVQNDCTPLGNPAKTPRVAIKCRCAYDRVKGELDPCERHAEMAEDVEAAS